MDGLSDEQIAYIAYEAHRAYCKMIGYANFKPWSNAAHWQQQSAIHGVRFHRANPDATAEDSHKNWLAKKQADGWHWGCHKDELQKTHPLMVKFEHLPPKAQMKDKLFVAVVHTLLEHALAPA